MGAVRSATNARRGKHLREREAAAEAVGELGKVARQMLGAEVVVSAMKGALDVAQNRVDPSERGMLGALRSTSGHERLVNAPCLLHGAEAAQGVGHHDGAGLQVAPGPGRDLLAAKPTDTAQAHPHRPALIIELHGGHERRLARRASPRFAAAALPAPVRIIELHPAAQRARIVTLFHGTGTSRRWTRFSWPSPRQLGRCGSTGVPGRSSLRPVSRFQEGRCWRFSADIGPAPARRWSNWQPRSARSSTRPDRSDASSLVAGRP